MCRPNVGRSNGFRPNDAVPFVRANQNMRKIFPKIFFFTFLKSKLFFPSFHLFFLYLSTNPEHISELSGSPNTLLLLSIIFFATFSRIQDHNSLMISPVIQELNQLSYQCRLYPCRRSGYLSR